MMRSRLLFGDLNPDLDRAGGEVEVARLQVGGFALAHAGVQQDAHNVGERPSFCLPLSVRIDAKLASVSTRVRVHGLLIDLFLHPGESDGWNNARAHDSHPSQARISACARLRAIRPAVGLHLVETGDDFCLWSERPPGRLFERLNGASKSRHAVTARSRLVAGSTKVCCS